MARSRSSVRKSAAKQQRWRKLLAAWRASGLSQAEFCRRRGVSAVTFSWWKSKLAHEEQFAGLPTVTRAQEESLQWIAVEVSGAGGSELREGFEVVLRSGRAIRVGPYFDAAGLRRLVAVLEELPC